MAETPQDSFDEMDSLNTEFPDEALEGVEPEPEPEPTPEPVSKTPESIPWDRFQEVYTDRQRLANEAQEQRNIIWQQQYMLSQQQMQRQTPPEPVDPQLAEVENLISPMIDKRLQSMAQKLQQFERVAMKVEATEEAQSALSFFESRVPDHKELEPDFIKYLGEMDPIDRQRVFQDPRFAVMTANAVRGMRDSGKLKSTAQAKDAVRGRAKSESGGNSPSLSSQSNIDYNDMSDEDFAKMDAQITRRARR